MTHHTEEQCNDAAIERGRDWLPYNLADDEMHEATTCPEHGQMNWYKGKHGEQIFVCTKCKEK